MSSGRSVARSDRSARRAERSADLAAWLEDRMAANVAPAKTSVPIEVPHPAQSTIAAVLSGPQRGPEKEGATGPRHGSLVPVSKTLAS